MPQGPLIKPVGVVKILYRGKATRANFNCWLLRVIARTWPAASHLAGRQCAPTRALTPARSNTTSRICQHQQPLANALHCQVTPKCWHTPVIIAVDSATANNYHVAIPLRHTNTPTIIITPNRCCRSGAGLGRHFPRQDLAQVRLCVMPTSLTPQAAAPLRSVACMARQRLCLF